jgi:secreted PhoX family phosphatase
VEQNIAAPNGYPLNQFRVPRAEDCEVVKNHDRRVLISLTSARGRPAPDHPAAFGVVRLLEEDSNDGDGRTFRWVDLLEGGPQSGFSNPDNMAFLTANDLLVVTDISTTSLNTPNFAFHGNNAAFYVPLTGPNANVAFRFANAPVEAELTGPTYNNLQKTLFLNVQHPGEESQRAGGVVGDPSTFTSWWPDGNKTEGTGTPGKPKPSLVAIRKV